MELEKEASIEKEALALTWACERFADYLVGSAFLCETDRKPSLPLLSSKNLDELPPCIQRFCMCLMRFCFTIFHVPLVIADTLSRAPLAKPTSADDSLQSEIEVHLNAVIDTLPVSEKHIKISYVTRKLMKFVNNLFPTVLLHGQAKLIFLGYYPITSELTVVNGLLMRGNRTVIPLALRVEILNKLHTGHQGITKCRERARQSVWWPGLSKQLEE